jgi:hypothetical protein
MAASRQGRLTFGNLRYPFHRSWVDPRTVWRQWLEETRLERWTLLEYTEILKVFFTPHSGQDRKIKGLTNATVVSKATMVSSHRCNNVFQQWSLFTLLQQSLPTITSGHGGCLVPTKKTRQTDTDGPITCSSLTLVWRTHKNSCSWQGSNPGHLANSLVPTVTTLPRLHVVFTALLSCLFVQNSIRESAFSFQFGSASN